MTVKCVFKQLELQIFSIELKFFYKMMSNLFVIGISFLHWGQDLVYLVILCIVFYNKKIYTTNNQVMRVTCSNTNFWLF